MAYKSLLDDFLRQGTLQDIVEAAGLFLESDLRGNSDYYLVFGQTIVEVINNKPNLTTAVEYGIQYLINQQSKTRVVCIDKKGQESVERMLQWRAESHGVGQGTLPEGWKKSAMPDSKFTAFEYMPKSPLQPYK